MGKPVRSRPRRSQRTRFTRSEIRQMENLLVEKKDELDQIFFQNVTKELNVASGRAGSRAIQMEQYQVQKWFQSKKRNQATEVTSSPNPLEEFINISDTSHSNSAPESSSDLPKDTGEKVPDETNLEFEARSSRDGAWYDVATFLTHRVLSSGELEVRVRYQGFGAEEDEWVNVKKAVRERSVPLESSECWKVAVGDLVLCFQENAEQATYYDARVIEIQRKLHDIRGCRCLFLIQYDHDQTEEKVNLRRLCRRPAN
ncbi:protein SAWADEE HOMEODOMAIN HOMOLOG 1 isoform X1 [Phoenix dactylifera]|uniref:Protein SAWADEE HOMEODOMAIN HOMOLOG 1 isoform X1 n=2 Tax=Phoenix dactylifera TaxID=42345 RepID=A0A8B9AUR7_PHODC|nr:protein SAWADEE HOMEODOMAIN HOMOLOG 1 isoform X1 [Phoenix dactylifera]